MANERRRSNANARPRRRSASERSRTGYETRTKSAGSGNHSAKRRTAANAGSQRRRSGKRRSKGFASWSLGKKIIVILAGVLVFLITAAIAVVASKWGKINVVELDIDKLNISEEAQDNGTGYLNVALFGLDKREADPELGVRSDTIMIASLNRETKKIKLVSVYRDTLMKLSDDTYNKANAAYAFGGAEDAVAMLNENLDLNIQDYVTVDFSALVDVIDALGGIDLEITEEEIPYLNNYVVEIIENIGQDSAPVLEPGMQHLNGIQATAYARIRYGGGDDYKRAERQRKVLEQVIQKAQKAKLSALNKMIDKVFDKVETSFSLTEVIAYAKDVKSYTLGETQGFPYESTTALLDVGDSIITTSLEDDVVKLHEFLFGETDYTPSSAVKLISKAIKNSTYDTGQSYDTEGSGYYDGYGYSDYSTYNSGYGDSTNNSYTDNSNYTDNGDYSNSSSNANSNNESSSDFPGNDTSSGGPVTDGGYDVSGDYDTSSSYSSGTENDNTDTGY